MQIPGHNLRFEWAHTNALFQKFKLLEQFCKLFPDLGTNHLMHFSLLTLMTAELPFINERFGKSCTGKLC